LCRQVGTLARLALVTKVLDSNNTTQGCAVMKNLLKKFIADESGAEMVEYALIIALIAIAVAVTVALVRDALNTTFNNIANCLNDPTNCPTTGGG
jgi:pilus assembly protein Flp/PilA